MSNCAIIAGSGRLPEILSEKLNAKIISFTGQEIGNITPDLQTNIGHIGEIIEFLKTNNIDQLVFAGGIKKPSISEIKTDAVGKKLLAKIAMASLFGKALPGDDALLSKVIKYMESQGFKVVGAHEVAPELLADKGTITGDITDFRNDIELGMEAAKELGATDEGQAVIIDKGEVIAKENEGGTETLIAKCGAGILVKCKKPQQDERIDLPSIGPDTIDQLKAAGLSGVAVEAGSSLILDKELVIRKAEEQGIFVFGV